MQGTSLGTKDFSNFSDGCSSVSKVEAGQERPVNKNIAADQLAEHLQELKWRLSLSLSHQLTASACWSPSWRWPWCRWVSRRYSTWCLALCSPASVLRCGAGSCPSSGLEVDLWWIPVWYDCLLRKNKKTLKKKGEKNLGLNNMQTKVEFQVE